MENNYIKNTYGLWFYDKKGKRIRYLPLLNTTKINKKKYNYKIPKETAMVNLTESYCNIKFLRPDKPTELSTSHESNLYCFYTEKYEGEFNNSIPQKEFRNKKELKEFIKSLMQLFTDLDVNYEYNIDTKEGEEENNKIEQALMHQLIELDPNYEINTRIDEEQDVVNDNEVKRRYEDYFRLKGFSINTIVIGYRLSSKVVEGIIIDIDYNHGIITLQDKETGFIKRDTPEVYMTKDRYEEYRINMMSYSIGLYDKNNQEISSIPLFSNNQMITIPEETVSAKLYRKHYKTKLGGEFSPRADNEQKTLYAFYSPDYDNEIEEAILKKEFKNTEELKKYIKLLMETILEWNIEYIGDINTPEQKERVKEIEKRLIKQIKE